LQQRRQDKNIKFIYRLYSYLYDISQCLPDTEGYWICFERSVVRVLSVIDVYTRECLALEVDTSFASRRVTRELEKIVVERGAPEAIRYDNGPEFTSRHFLAWAIERKIELAHIEPGRPVQNAYLVWEFV
jgi:transposase InsO family protein